MPRVADNPLTVRTLRAEDSERIARLHSGVPRSLDECVTCRGRGTFRWWDDHASASRAPVEWECNCPEQFKLYKHLLNSGLGKAHQRLAWADAVAIPDATHQIIADYRANAEYYVDAGMGLVLTGPPGTGKTLITVLLSKGLIADGLDAYFVTFEGLVGFFTAGWTSAEDRAWFERRIQHAGVLVIDDLGRHKTKADLADSVLDRVVRSRINASLPTMISSNLEEAEVGSQYSSNVLSLLSGSSIFHRINGTDYRPDYAAVLKEEVREKLTRPLVLG